MKSLKRKYIIATFCFGLLFFAGQAWGMYDDAASNGCFCFNPAARRAFLEQRRLAEQKRQKRERQIERQLRERIQEAFSIEFQLCRRMQKTPIAFYISVIMVAAALRLTTDAIYCPDSYAAKLALAIGIGREENGIWRSKSSPTNKASFSPRRHNVWCCQTTRMETAPYNDKKKRAAVE
ncbi:hypothetical protein ACFLX2_00135 [Candidatus Dependentiae bacterium]